MDGIAQILVLLAFLSGGAVLVKIGFAPRGATVDTIVKYVLWVLLFGMGFRIGNNPGLYAHAKEMGMLAFATAFLSVLGSCLAVLLASLVVPGMRREDIPAGIGPEAANPQGARVPVDFFAHMKAPLTLLGIVVVGFLAGFLMPPAAFDIGIVTSWTLNALLFFIGMQFTQSGVSLKKTLTSPAAIAVPLATLVGTLSASLALVPLFSLSPGKAMALAGGFGWYSLSGVLIANLGDPVLGSTSFLANMFRESLALILIPFLGRSRVPTLAVSVGGATAMDVTLPLIEQSAGPWIVPISFMSGALLSLVVPFLVPLCFRLG